MRKLIAETGDAPRTRGIHVHHGTQMQLLPQAGRREEVDGPDLSGVGGKLGKDALLDAILNPSAGIAPEYYVWILDTRSQG